MEQHRRSMGDQVKSKIHVLGGKQDWGIAARCHAVLPCSTAVFRALVVPSADKVTPVGFDSKTELVLAEVNSTQQIAEIFGSTKIKGGTRYGSWSARKMDLVFKPQEGELRAWWVTGLCMAMTTEQIGWIRHLGPESSIMIALKQ